MKKLMSLLSLMCILNWSVQAQSNMGEIMGKVFEKSDTEDPAIGATVWVMRSGAKIAAKVDAEGRFRISAVPAGTYLLEAAYLSDTLQEPIYLEVQADGIKNIGRIDILEKVTEVGEFTVYHSLEGSLIDFGDVGIKRISAKDIMLSPVRNDPGQLIVSRNSDIKMNQDGELIIRGARPGDMTYFVDGVKTEGVRAIPSVAIGGMTVYSSAIPAKYGDTTGGVIILESKSYHDLVRAKKIAQGRR